MIGELIEDVKEFAIAVRRDYKEGKPRAWICRLTGNHHYVDAWRGDRRILACTRCPIEGMVPISKLKGAW